jgi:hypothetical protein
MLHKDQSASWNNRTFEISGQRRFYPGDESYRLTAGIWERLREVELERLENVDCIREYSLTFSERRRHLILVIAEKEKPTRHEPSRIISHRANFGMNAYGGCQPDRYDWLCYAALGGDCHWGEGCSKQARRIDPHNWKTFGGLKPEYCLSETVPQTCGLRFSSRLAWVVISFNILKLLILIVCCLPKGPLDREQPLLTIGDAISSFLRHNDQTTSYLCAMGASDLGRWTGDNAWKGVKVQIRNRRLETVYYPLKRNRLFHTVPRYRWILLTLL